MIEKERNKGFGASVSAALTKDAHECPKCGHTDRVGASGHYYHSEGKMAFMCQACHHVWRGCDAGGFEG